MEPTKRQRYMKHYYKQHRRQLIAYTKKWNKAHPERYRATLRRWRLRKLAADPLFRLQLREWSKESYYKHRAKRLAYAKRHYKGTQRIKAVSDLNHAVRDGRIVRPTACAQCCVVGKVEGHHYKGYEYALDVRWLCRPCHERVHHPSPT